ncbi:hypothetical protein MMC18_006674 [Xylographa bjoerkii]|nr:hypothetical protein [Xylographa bjoerkii]
MNFNPVRSVLKHNREYVCFYCLFRCTFTARWQRPCRRASSNKVILPAISPSASAALHGDIDKADRIRSKSERRPAARQRKSTARTLSVETKTSTAKASKRNRKTKELGGGLPPKLSHIAASEDVPPGKGKVDGKINDTSGSSKDLEFAALAQWLKDSRSVKPTAVEGKIKHNSKKGNQGVTTTIVEGPEVDQGKDEDSATSKFGEDRGTTKLECSEISHAEPFRRVTARVDTPSAAVRKVISNIAFRKVTNREIARLPVRSRRSTLKQRRQEALERRRKLLNKTTRPSSNSLPQLDSIEEPRETLFIPTKTIREALVGPWSIDRVATKSNKNGLSQYPTAHEAWLGETTKKSSVRNVYRKDKEKVDAVESMIKQKLLKSDIKHINAHDYTISALDVRQPAVPRLSYGLDRVLFNPGVYHLQDPRSRVYNFDPYLQSIMPVSEFDFTALKEYITSSRDTSLKQIAEEHGKRYVGSTSSMTGVLAHFHFLLSQWREINTTMLSRGFPDKLTSFTLIQRCPSAIFLRWKNGTYAIDADKEYATSNILSMLGKAMEKLLTLNTEDFERYRKSNPDQLSQEERIEPEAFHYSTMGDFLMRSQLDAYDPRLPGTGMFDLKTRAVVTIRMDTQNPEQGSSYEIKERFGEYESFEREYFDMIRSAFLKYSLQVRMGRMDGIFVAFHNTERIFGFQYISLEEMDLTLHGQSDTTLGDQEFKLSLELLNQVLDRATQRFPEQSVRIHFETRDATTPFMYIFAEPVTEDEVNELQSRNQAKIEELERELLGLHKDEENAEEDCQWDDIQAKVEEAMEKDERGEERLRVPVASENTALEHEIEDYVEASTLNEANERNGAEVDHEILAAATTEIEEHDGGQDEVDGQGEAVSDSDQALSKKEDVVEHTKGDEEERDLLSEIKHTSEDEAVPESQTHLEHLQDFPGGDGDVELPNNQATTQEQDRQSNNPEQGTPNQAEGDPAFPYQHIVASNQTMGSDKPPNFDSKADSAFLNTLTAERSTSVPNTHPPVLAMTLTVRNKVDGKYVLRPENITSPKPPYASETVISFSSPRAAAAKSNQGWSIEYTLTDVENDDRAWALYQACQARRKKRLDPEETDEENERAQRYVQLMRELNLRGKKWRAGMEREESGKKAVVLGINGEDI